MVAEAEDARQEPRPSRVGLLTQHGGLTTARPPLAPWGPRALVEVDRRPKGARVCEGPVPPLSAEQRVGHERGGVAKSMRCADRRSPSSGDMPLADAARYSGRISGLLVD